MLQESGQLFPPEKLQNSDLIEIVILVETNITLLVTSGNRTDKQYQKYYKNMNVDVKVALCNQELGGEGKLND